MNAAERAGPGPRGRRPANPRPPPAPGTAFEVAVRLLARRPHARAELRRKLLRRGHPAGEVDAALTRALELGYLDDEAFAAALVRYRSAGRGRLAMAAELAERGVGREQAAAALSGWDRGDELATAIRLARRELARLKLAAPEPGTRERTDLEVLLNRAGPKLLRRGFASGVAREACRLALVTPSP